MEMTKDLSSYTGCSQLDKLAHNLALIMLHGTSPEDVLKHLLTAYTQAKTPAVRRRIGALMAMTMSPTSELMAKTCAEKFNIERTDLNYTWGETIMRKCYATSRKLYCMTATQKCHNELLSLPWVFGSTEANDFTSDTSFKMLKVLNDEKRHYVYRNSDGRINVLIIDNTCADLLIDEDVFDGAHPLYFSEYSRYHSPVCIARTYAFILQSILALMGYSPLSIGAHVIFTNYQTRLLNIDEYRTLPQWHDVTVGLRSEDNGHLLHDVLPISDAMDEYELAIAATALVYQTLDHETQFFGTLTIDDIEKIVIKQNILKY